MENEKSLQNVLKDLKERAKELNCLYQVEEVLHRKERSIEEMLSEIIKIIPGGFQFPELCMVRIIIEGQEFSSENLQETAFKMFAPISIEEKEIGEIIVFYRPEVLKLTTNIFLNEEQRLLNSIADRIGKKIVLFKFEEISQQMEIAQKAIREKKKNEWMVVVDILRRTDQQMFLHIARKMIYYLYRIGVREATEIFQQFAPRSLNRQVDYQDNQPSRKESLEKIIDLGVRIFEIASLNLSDEEIFDQIHRWIEEDKASFLVKAIDNMHSSVAEVIEALNRYRLISDSVSSLPEPVKKGLVVSLIRRFLSEQLDFINIAKNYLYLHDFYEIIDRVIYAPGSYGSLGGKSAGLFLAYKILTQSTEYQDVLADLKVPRTWFIAADTIINFLHYNNMEELTEQKYKDLQQVRLEYHNVIQLLKNAHFPPEIIRGLEKALDDFGPVPLIVRSSSLLEDRFGTSFSGKYKSLFLANQGTKEERLSALLDAIAEVYASVFGPDPIEYRAERGLIDFHEEMGIIIQEVVGVRLGDYFLPYFAGVAFSNNEFRWSPRIKREDGLIRLVFGLGTRAVDRTSDDYPVLVAPAQPNLRANVSLDEVLRYSPRYADVINLKTNSFETVPIKTLLEKIPVIPNYFKYIFSVLSGDFLRPLSPLDLESEKANMFVSFEELLKKTDFVKKIHSMLRCLQEKLQTPVDLEFACDGKNFYLLQCRPQSQSRESGTVQIPRDLNAEEIIFNARKYVSNGNLSDITHIVYVDPQRYAELEKMEDLLAVGRVISALNKILPKKQFILIGPGRWGSRGDIKLGVAVTYSDFNNTAMLVEVARRRGGYTPELSFGTHFFQDLVESEIRYLPLYPDDKGIIFREDFLKSTPQLLSELLPEFHKLADVVFVTDVRQASGGRVLRILMSGDQNEAVAFLIKSERTAFPKDFTPFVAARQIEQKTESHNDDYWRWRLYMAEKIGQNLDGKKYGVKGLYIFGSTKNATARPASDIDLLIHFCGDEKQKSDLLQWLQGWSQALAEFNYQRTGVKTVSLLDIHFVTDREVKERIGFAAKIGAITDPARPLPLLSVAE